MENLKLAAIVMMQKNEQRLLEFWIKYHADIFGYENLFVFDNGSDCSVTIDVLNDAFNKGANIIWSCNSPSDFENKGKILSQKARELFGDGYEYVVPLDCDEMLCLIQGETKTPVLNKDAIVDELVGALDCKEHLFRIEHTFFNIPGGHRFYYSGIRKLILKKSDKVVDLDTGFHLYDFNKKKDLVDPGIIRPSSFAVLHFHNKPYSLFIKSAREKMKLRVRSFSRSELSAYKGKGNHLIPYFFMSEEEYLKRFTGGGSLDLREQFGDIADMVPYADHKSVCNEGALRELLDPFNAEYFVGKVNMTRREVLSFGQCLAKAMTYIEYGVGGSTAMACESGVQNIFSIETDLDFISKVIEKYCLNPYVLGGRINFKHIDFRQTKEWGYPVLPLDARRVKAYLGCLLNPPLNPDVILIDGRYRAACAIASYIGCPGAGDILIHDYFSRPHYHIVEEIFNIKSRVDDLVYLERKSGMDRRAQELLNIYLSDPR